VALLDALVGSTLFRGVSVAQCEAFLPLVRERRARRDEYLFRLGEPAEALYIIRQGTVHLTMPLAMHGTVREVTVQEAGPGDTIAWSAFIEPFRFTMSARAGADVDLLGLSTRELQAAVEAHPDAGVLIVTNLARVIARRLQLIHTMWTRELQRSVNEVFG
jgi:CRP/FNR family transcriptional regulator, cyclic AMP receptor protein